MDEDYEYADHHVTGWHATMQFVKAEAWIPDGPVHVEVYRKLGRSGWFQRLISSRLDDVRNMIKAGDVLECEAARWPRMSIRLDVP